MLAVLKRGRGESDNLAGTRIGDYQGSSRDVSGAAGLDWGNFSAALEGVWTASCLMMQIRHHSGEFRKES